MASPRSPDRVKTVNLAYPIFPRGKGRRTFPVETPKEYGKRLKVMSAYLNGIYQLLARFKDANKFFKYRGLEIKRKDIRNLLKQWTTDFKDLKRFYNTGIANAKSKGRKGAGFKIPEIMSPKMYAFLKSATLGNFYNADGSLSPDARGNVQLIKDAALTNVLNDEFPLHGVVGRGVLLTVFATYIHENGLVGKALVNQGKSRKDWNASWIGADDVMKQFFGDEIQRGIAESNAHREKYGEVEGTPMKFKSDGTASTIPAPGEKLKISQLWFPFNPDQFRWSDVSKVFVKGNVTKNPRQFHDDPAVVDARVAAFPSKEDMTPLQVSDMAKYNRLRDATSAAQLAGKSQPYTQLAMQAADVQDATALFEKDIHLFSRATSEDVQYMVSNSNKGLNKVIKAGVRDGTIS